MITTRRTTPCDGPPTVAIAPADSPEWIHEAALAGGAQIFPVEDADSLIWSSPVGGDELGQLIEDHNETLRWVQLPWAGVEPLIHLIDDRRIFTCGKGVYADPVAEHALAMLLAGFRALTDYARADTWGPERGRNLFDARITVMGGGGITASLLSLLAPFRADVTVVRNRPTPMPGASKVVGWNDRSEAIGGADALVLALALTDETRGFLDADTLALLPDHAWVVNVARGEHIATDDLADALAAGRLGGAALDVTDPEPLPAGHRLWSEPRCLITPHIGNTEAMKIPLLGARITDNVRRWGAGEDLIGPVDPALGY